MDVAAGQNSTPFFRIPSILWPSAPEPVGPSGFFRFTIENLDVLLEPRIRLDDEVSVESALGRPFDRALGRERFPHLRMRPLKRLREHLQLLQDSRALHHRICAAIWIGRTDAQDLVELAARFARLEVCDGLLMVPARENRRNREELSAIGKRRLRPGLENDLVRFLIIRAIAFLVLDRREGPAEHLGLAQLVPSPDSEFEPAAAYDIEHRGLLRDSHRMPPGHYVRGLAETNLARARGDRRFRQQRIGAELGTFGLKMVLGHEEIVEAELVSQNSLAYLPDQPALAGFVNLGEVAVVDSDARRGSHDWKIRCAVVEYAYFDHDSSVERPILPARLRPSTGLGRPTPGPVRFRREACGR